MKKIILTTAILSIAASLTACGGSYKKTQTIEEMQQPMNCAGLNMKRAQWSFVDDFGQQVEVTGTCKKGMKHGNFTFSVGGNKIAVSKFIKDQENKTSCFANGEKSRIDLQSCMQKNSESSVAPAAVSAEDEAEDAE